MKKRIDDISGKPLDDDKGFTVTMHLHVLDHSDRDADGVTLTLDVESLKGLLVKIPEAMLKRFSPAGKNDAKAK